MKIKRLISIYIDYMIVCMLVLPFTWIIEYIFDIQREAFAGGNLVDLFLHSFKDTFFLFQMILVWTLFSLKDFAFKNSSIGKKLFKLEVISKDDKKPTKLNLFFRNIFMIVWPIEIIMILIINKRLGDYVFRTKVLEKTVQE